MQWCRIAFAFMLILALLPALSAMPPKVSGEGYVTITTQTTTTGLYTSAATTRYETATTRVYVYSPFNYTFYNCGGPIGGGVFYNAYTRLAIQAIQGQDYHFEWTTADNRPLDFYITTPFSASQVGCLNGVLDNFPASAERYHYKGAVGSVEWVAPSTGEFRVWFWNLNPPPPGCSAALACPVSGTFSVWTGPVTTTLSSASYVTAPTTELLVFATAVSAAVSQVALPFGTVGLLGAGALVAVIASVFMFTRRRKPSPAVALKQEQPATVQESPRDAVAFQPVTQSPVAAALKQEHAVVQEPKRDIVFPEPVVQAKAVQSQPLVSTWYVDLDRALDGGIPEKFGVVVVSPSYDERDLLLRKIVESALSSGRLGILVSNDMGRTEDLTSRFTSGFYAFSSQADKILGHGPNLLKVPGIENLNDANLSLSLAIKSVLAKESGTKPIIILDVLSDALLRHKSVTTRRWLSDFVGKRKAEGFTIIATLNPLTTTKEETQSIIDFFDGVIEIFEKPLMERSRRFLVIRKMYGRRYSDNEVLMDKDRLF